MAKEICISSSPHETRLAILEDDQLSEIYYERENEYTLAGSIYKGRVTRVLPGMQSAFVDIGLERDAFLYVTDFLDEQEDAEEYERVSAPEKGRREGKSTRNENKEPKEVHEAKEAQEPRHKAEASRPVTPEPEVASSEEESEDEEFERQGTRRWRGRRGRRRGVRNEPQQSQRQAHELTVETAPVPADEPEASSEAVLVEEAVAAESPKTVRSAASRVAAPAVFVLPGEQLSKYGGQPAGREEKKSAAAASAKNFSLPKPSTLIETPIVWDGGSLLPGESRARFRDIQKVEAEPTGVFADAAAVEVTEAEAPVAEAPSAIVEGEPEVVLEASAPIAEETLTDEVVAAEPATEEVAAVEALDVASEPEAVEGKPEEAEEQEPTDASASYRIDPLPPSEFRLSAPSEPDSFDEPSKETQAEAGVAPEPVAEAKSETPEVAPVSEPEPEGFFEIEEQEEELQQGMLSFDHVPYDTEEEVFFPEEQPVQKIEEAEAAEVAEPTAPEAVQEAKPSNHAAFSPGAGLLEEEIIEEEEDEVALFQSPEEEHDLDELEEETLDHQLSGELGEMFQEAHLDHKIQLSFGAGSETEEEEMAEDVESDESEDLTIEAEEDEEVAETEEGTAAPAPHRRRDDRKNRGRNRGRRGSNRRPTAQTTDLPVISDLLKPGQEILVQIAKEPIAKKGARITSHIALPGRFLVFMPTVNHVGVSRKISSDEERQRLKRILISEKGEVTGGFIVRTAADGATEEELRADMRFLLNLWAEIKHREESSKSPALIYHDLNLVERILRDQVTDNFSTIWVDSESDYERIVRFLNRFQPSLVRRVKLYTKETPLFEQFGIQDEITKALKSKVWLKSGGSIVINQTEALVAIDINTGKYVGKTARLEDTILKTNLDAIPEIVRQIRLRDLGGIIVIDFIDMDERKNRHKVMQALEEALKADRAPSKVLQFNDFGLVAITRKRVKQSLERTLSVQCPICSGTGMVKSAATVCNEIYIEMRKMQKHFEHGDVLLRVNPEVVKALKANNARWLTELEEMIRRNIIVKSDPSLHPEQFDIH